MKRLAFLVLSIAAVSCGRDELLGEKIRTLTEMSELGTVEYTVKKIIKADDDAWYKYGDRKILYQSVAYIKAGIDLAAFKAEDITFDKKSRSISVVLPKPKVLSFNMPFEQIKLVYCNVSGFRKDFSPEDRLNLKQQAEEAIREDISNMGILEDAAKNARDFFAAMFSGCGYDEIDIHFNEKEL